MSKESSQNSLAGHSEQNRYVLIDINGLAIGARLNAPIYDRCQDRVVLLLAAGSTLTESLISRLKSRGISQVLVQESELIRITKMQKVEKKSRTASGSAKTLRMQDKAASSQSENSLWKITSRSFLQEISEHRGEKYNSTLITEFDRAYRSSMLSVQSLFDGLTKGEIGNTIFTRDIAKSALHQIARDIDLFLSVGFSPHEDRYPYQQSIKTSMLAMAMGTVLGLREGELIELGMGSLAHDAGMLLVNPKLIKSDKVLSQIDFLEITKHPIYSFDLLSKANNVPNGARLVAYQMHERCNGSGYPRQRQSSQIHPLSKIAAVADVYSALISTRPHRPSMLPYNAIEQIIHDTNKGLYDSTAVRALLETVSLFPIGSYVELNDGRVGKVLRSNREYYTQPVVKVWSPEAIHLESEIIDLSNSSEELKVVRPLMGPEESSVPREPAFSADLLE